MTTTFYVPPERIARGRVDFPEEEARHIAQVLRHKVDDLVRVVDGMGRAYQVRLSEIRKSVILGEIVSDETASSELHISITLGLGLLKNRSRIEMVVEKATELGVASIIPLESERSERSSLRIDRLESIAIAAMKQSGRAVLPVIHRPERFENVVSRATDGFRLICHERSPGHTLEVAHVRSAGSVLLLVGPEGGFTEDEVAVARGRGFAEWYLGARRLRAETAAIASVSALAMISEGVIIDASP